MGSLLAAQVADAQLLSKLAPDLNQLLAQTGLTTTVIVQWNQNPGLVEKLEIGLLGGVIKQTLSSFPGQVIELPVGSLLGLLNLPGVALVDVSETKAEPPLPTKVQTVVVTDDEDNMRVERFLEAV